MKKATQGNEKVDIPIYCNACGRELIVENGLLKEDAFEATKEWGFFSDKDTTVHQFNICEKCYDRMIADFKIPVVSRTKLEVL